jgi:two-component system sensor histidine kinase RegB
MLANPDRIGASLIASLARVTRPQSAPGEISARENLLLLIHLRWIAVIGQVVTIIIVRTAFHVEPPVVGMSLVLAALVALNIAGGFRLKLPAAVENRELFLVLIFDTLALTAQLYLTGGVTNPFTSLYLLQVILSAVLLESWYIWAIVGLTVACFYGLTVSFRPLVMPSHVPGELMRIRILGMLVGFVLDATLLAILVTRITANLRTRDARLADLRQQATEEAHIVRIGLLASGAAHELGTPLATLDVILSDWRRMPKLALDPDLAQDVQVMQAEVRRCKAIVTDVLLSAGEARGEAPVVTTIKAFLDDVIEDWRASRSTSVLAYEDKVTEDVAIVSDSALKQMIHNVLDNALEASPKQVGVTATRRDDELLLAVSDNGPGFPAEMLANFGKPYNSSKRRLGGGLGLFLVVNVVRKLGGRVVAENLSGGGARVTLVLPLSALRMESLDGR